MNKRNYLILLFVLLGISCSSDPKSRHEADFVKQEVERRYNILSKSRGFKSINIKYRYIDLYKFDSLANVLIQDVKNEKISPSDSKGRMMELLSSSNLPEGLKNKLFDIITGLKFSDLCVDRRFEMVKLLLYDELLLLSRSPYRFNRLRAVVSADKNVVNIGDTFVARVHLSATDDLWDYETLCYSNSGSQLLHLPPENGEGIFKSVYSTPGKKTFSGVIVVENEFGEFDSFPYFHHYKVR